MSTVLVVNSGSSSIKYQLVDPVEGGAIASGLVERIGEATGSITHTFAGTTTERTRPIADHGDGLRAVLELFEHEGPDLSTASAVGHRVVHGGSVFDGPALVTDEVIAQTTMSAISAPCEKTCCRCMCDLYSNRYFLLPD